MMLKVHALALFACLLTLPVQARDWDDIANPRQTHRGWVTDEPGILGTAADLIETRLDALERETGAEVAWVVVRTIGARDGRQLGTELLHRWGVGRKEQDDGVLVLHVLDQRRVEIVTGYGVEASLPDVKCSWLLQEVAVPAFRAGEYARGHVALSRGIDRALRSPDISHDELIAAAQLSSRELAEIQPRPQPTRQLSFSNPSRSKLRWTACVLAVLAFVAYVWRIRKMGRLGTPNLDVFEVLVPCALFGGLIPFTAGMFDRGPSMIPAIGVFTCALCMAIVRGSRDSRALQKRLAPRPCPRCSGQLRWLEGDEATALLSAGAVQEQKLKSMRFEVRRCDCGEVSVNGHELESAVIRCQSCRFRTLEHVQTLTHRAATELETGEAEWIYECAVCSHEAREVVVVPRVTRESSPSSSDSSSSSGSDSSSSSSSDSFGGGDSGGGGAGASY